MAQNDTRTLAQRWADLVTRFSGSWAFIGVFTIFCIGWIGLNTIAHTRWDPYPFLFLNWFLTIVSTFQNPIILLSQNRQNDNDRENVKEILDRLAALQIAVDTLQKASTKKHNTKT